MKNEANCVLTIFGKCSYNETGCSDCEIKEKIRKALENEPKKGKWIKNPDCFICSVCNGGYKCQPTLMGNPLFEFCPMCGADMREADNGS